MGGGLKAANGGASRPCIHGSSAVVASALTACGGIVLQSEKTRRASIFIVCLNPPKPAACCTPANNTIARPHPDVSYEMAGSTHAVVRCKSNQIIKYTDVIPVLYRNCTLPTRCFFTPTVFNAHGARTYFFDKPRFGPYYPIFVAARTPNRALGIQRRSRGLALWLSFEKSFRPWEVPTVGQEDCVVVFHDFFKFNIIRSKVGPKRSVTVEAK
jgi:hypothetical protein